MTEDQSRHHQDESKAAAEAGSLTSPAADLPPDALVLVLALVPQQQRLGMCSSVSHSWQAAAAAASSSIAIDKATAARLAGAPTWLAKHGHHVMQLRISGREEVADVPTLRQLPCSRLRDLQLESFRLQLAASPSHAGVLPGLSSLTRLCLGQRITYLRSRLDGAGGLTALSGLTSLQHLQVDSPSSSGASMEPDAPEFPAEKKFPAGVVSRLVSLTHLELGNFVVTEATLQQLSRVSGLRHLSLAAVQHHADLWWGCVEEDAVASIWGVQHLTLLQMKAGWPVFVSPNDTPGLARLTSLQHLELMVWFKDASILSHLVQLRSLSLRDCRFTSDVGAGDPATVLKLLAALPSLQHLTALELDCSLGQPAARAAPAAAYSALTASSQLRVLHLAGCILPAGVWPVMFGRQLPHLTSLAFTMSQPAPSPSDLQRMCASCPALCDLDLRDVVQSDAHLAALLPALAQLPQLARLGIDHVDDAAAGGLAQLTGLADLWIGWPNDVTVAGLEHLAELQRLTGLGIADEDNGASDDDDDDDEADEWSEMKFLFVNAAPRGQAPDVHKQVQAAVAAFWTACDREDLEEEAASGGDDEGLA